VVLAISRGNGAETVLDQYSHGRSQINTSPGAGLSSKPQATRSRTRQANQYNLQLSYPCVGLRGFKRHQSVNVPLYNSRCSAA
jgi:hypothetical protein